MKIKLSKSQWKLIGHKTGWIKISRDDKGYLNFDIIPKETVYLNSTEYIIVYQSV